MQESKKNQVAKTFRVWNRETESAWIIRQPSVDDCNQACDFVAEQHKQNWLDLGAIRTDDGTQYWPASS